MNPNFPDGLLDNAVVVRLTGLIVGSDYGLARATTVQLSLVVVQQRGLRRFPK